MTKIEHGKHARKLREQGDLEAAGEFYVASGFGYLMQFRRTEGDSISPQQIGGATQMLMLGALCFRCAGAHIRAKRYCSIASEIVADLRTVVRSMRQPTADPRLGLCHEFQGDFQTLGEFGDPADAYDRAQDRYEKVEQPRRWSDEPEFGEPLLVLFDLADSVGFDTTVDERAAIKTSLVDRIEFKREHFGRIVDRVIEDGNWESETW